MGGTVLAHLLNHPERKNFDITALVRDEAKAKILSTNFGLNTVIGTHQDLDKVASLAEAAHIVFNIVSLLLSLYRVIPLTGFLTVERRR